MNENKTLAIMKATGNKILEYLEEQREINIAALKAYEPTPILDDDAEVRRMREREAITLRDRITQLSTYIAVAKRMIP